MPKTHYGYDIRAAVCLHCGAPLNVDVGGGTVVCEYCQTPNLVRRRNDRRDRKHATIVAPQTALPESERLRQLRLQDHRPLAVPPALQPWLRAGKLKLKHKGDVLKMWLRYRRILVSQPAGQPSADHLSGQYLFALTLLLAPLLDDRHERALLENAVDVLPDVNHRNVLRCRLAHHAAVEREQRAAEAWLGPVDPRPRDLMADTAYRLAVSYVALTRNQPQGVFQQLGRHDEDVPIFDGYDEEAFLLRCHALELTGDEDEAFRRWRCALPAGCTSRR